MALREFEVMDNSNIYYTDENGKNVYDAQQKGKFVWVDTTRQFSSNLQLVDGQPSDDDQIPEKPQGYQALKNRERRTFWEYIKSDILNVTIITVFTLAMAIISYYENVMFMTYFMSFVFALLWVASFIDWKRKG